MTNSMIYNEVVEMLNNMPLKDYLKIPHEIIGYMKNNISINTKINNNDYSKDSYILFLKIYIQYIASNNEKKELTKMLQLNETKNEYNKSKKYNSKELFKNNNIIKNIKHTEIVTVKKKWYERILEKIKNIFYKK